MEEDAVEGKVVCESGEEVLQALNEIKTRNVPGPSDVSLELIAASGGVGIQVMAEICQSHRIEWALSIVVPIIKGEGDIRSCICYGAVKLLYHGMRVVEC